MSDYKNKHYRHSGKGRNLREEANKSLSLLSLWDLVDDSEEDEEDEEDE